MVDGGNITSSLSFTELLDGSVEVSDIARGIMETIFDFVNLPIVMLRVVNSHDFLADSWLKLTILVWHLGKDEGALLASLGLDGAKDGADDGVGDAGLGLEALLVAILNF